MKYYEYIDGVRYERNQKWFDDQFFYYTSPIWDSVVRDLGICINCLCWDCGCCYGCGQINADLFGAHGYPGCV